MRTEHIYEVIYAILAEILLKKGDIVCGMVKTFKKRFGANYGEDIFGMNEAIAEHNLNFSQE